MVGSGRPVGRMPYAGASGKGALIRRPAIPAA
jgi:hypothetical protein